MTTKPKAKKFRLKRQQSDSLGTPDDGFGDIDFRNTPPQEQQAKSPGRSNASLSIEQEIAQIKAEGLSGRQLRSARRVAQRHDLKVKSDFDAVRQLRAMGIDPFAGLDMLAVVGGKEAEANTPNQSPLAKVNPTKSEPKKPIDEAQRAAEIMRIQRDIARRRRRQVALLSVRLFFFVIMPTMIVAFYYFAVATSLYATKSEFVIQQAGMGASSSSSLSSMFSGTGLATQQDSVGVQSYLTSRDAMNRLNQDLGFIDHFSSRRIDALRRIDPNATQEEAFRLYQNMVKVGYDPTEGLIKMEVIAADPQTSQAFSEALIGYAEEQVDQLTARLRNDQMKGARESYEEANQRLIEAQERVVLLQEQLNVIAPDIEIANKMNAIARIEDQIRSERVRLDRLMSNARPNETRVQVIEGNIASLQRELDVLRISLTENGRGDASMARISAQLSVAQIDLQTRTALLQQSLGQLESSRIEADSQVRYLSNSVRPIAPDEPTYPRAFENTLLAFLVFSGIYLMISLTTSVLREQVSA